VASKKTILITGSTGFLGSRIEKELSRHHDVITLSRQEGGRKHIKADLKDEIPVIAVPSLDLVIHAAGKAHIVPKTEEEKQDFYDVNLKGSENLLKAFDNAKVTPKALVFISTVAVYGRESGIDISEDAPLLAKDPYGSSKKLAEEKILSWGIEHDVKVTIFRLPLLIGKNAPGNLGAMINGIKKGFYFNIGIGSAKRSMVLVDDVAKNIVEASEIGGIYNLTDGIDPSYGEISNKMGALLKKKIKNMPVFLAKLLANSLTILENLTGKKLPFSRRVFMKMTSSLTFSSKKAEKLINWRPLPVLENLNKIL